MQFHKLTINKLKELQDDGYNLLVSNHGSSDEQVVWFAEKIDDLCEYLVDMDYSGEASKEPVLLIIDEVIKHYQDDDLVGMVFN